LAIFLLEPTNQSDVVVVVVVCHRDLRVLVVNMPAQEALKAGTEGRTTIDNYLADAGDLDVSLFLSDAPFNKARSPPPPSSRVARW
jgi:hypothetical protein